MSTKTTARSSEDIKVIQAVGRPAAITMSPQIEGDGSITTPLGFNQRLAPALPRLPAAMQEQDGLSFCGADRIRNKIDTRSAKAKPLHRFHFTSPYDLRDRLLVDDHYHRACAAGMASADNRVCVKNAIKSDKAADPGSCLSDAFPTHSESLS